jgi:hypothetical protein
MSPAARSSSFCLIERSFSSSNCVFQGSKRCELGVSLCVVLSVPAGLTMSLTWQAMRYVYITPVNHTGGGALRVCHTYCKQERTLVCCPTNQ